MNKSLLLLGLLLLSSMLIACGDGAGTGLTNPAGTEGIYSGPTGEATITEENVDDVLEALKYASTILPIQLLSESLPYFVPATWTAAGAELSQPVPPAGMGGFLGLTMTSLVQQLPPLEAPEQLGLSVSITQTVTGTYGGFLTVTVTGIMPSDLTTTSLMPDSLQLPLDATIDLTCDNYMLSPTGPLVDGGAALSIRLVDRNGSTALETINVTTRSLHILARPYADVVFNGCIDVTLAPSLLTPLNVSIASCIDFVDLIKSESYRDQSTTHLRVLQVPSPPSLTASSAGTVAPVLDYGSEGDLWTALIGGSVHYVIGFELGASAAETQFTLEATGADGSSLSGEIEFQYTLDYVMANRSVVIPMKVHFDKNGDGQFEYETVYPFFDFSYIPFEEIYNP